MVRGGEIGVFGGASLRLQACTPGSKAAVALLWGPESRRAQAGGAPRAVVASSAAAKTTRSTVLGRRQPRGGLAWELKRTYMAGDFGRPLTARGAWRRHEPGEPAPGGRGSEPRHHHDGASNMLASARLARLPSSSRHCSAHGTARRKSAAAGGSSACCRSSDSFMMATVDDTAKAAVGPGAPRGDGGLPPTRAIANGGRKPPSKA